jgi:predicted transcriptional regulator
METIIFMNSTDKNLNFELDRLKMKYKTFESLRDKVISLKCEDPEKLDDFIIWKYLKSSDSDKLNENAKTVEKGDTNNQNTANYENDDHESIAGDPESEVIDKEVEQVNIISFSEYLSFETFDIYSAVSPKRMEVLDYININEPKSVKDLAIGLGRDYKNIYDDVLGLSKFGLVNLIKIGRNKTPVTRVDYIQVIPKKY